MQLSSAALAAIAAYRGETTKLEVGQRAYAPSCMRAAERGATKDDVRAAELGYYVPGINKPAK